MISGHLVLPPSKNWLNKWRNASWPVPYASIAHDVSTQSTNYSILTFLLIQIRVFANNSRVIFLFFVSFIAKKFSVLKFKIFIYQTATNNVWHSLVNKNRIKIMSELYLKVSGIFLDPILVFLHLLYLYVFLSQETCTNDFSCVFVSWHDSVLSHCFVYKYIHIYMMTSSPFAWCFVIFFLLFFL